MTDQLYRRVPHGKTHRYVPVTENDSPCVVTLTDRQCITAAGSLGTMLLMIFERNMDPKKIVARKIKKVEEAILDLFQSTGESIDQEIQEKLCTCWDRTMQTLSEGF